MNTGRLVAVYRRTILVLIIGLLALRGMPSIDASEDNLFPPLELADLQDQIHSLAQYRGRGGLDQFPGDLVPALSCRDAHFRGDLAAVSSRWPRGFGSNRRPRRHHSRIQIAPRNEALVSHLN